MPYRYLSRVLVLVILAAAFAVRLFRLGASSLWYDETVSLYLARLDLVALTRHTAGDIHPPLYYYLLHFWGQLTGWSEFSTAWLSLFFGVLLIALAYRVASEWIGNPGAIVSALLVAASPYNLWYSQEVRMYTLGATLGLASVYFLVRTWAHPPTVRSWLTRDLVAYIVVSALGLYTLSYFVFVLVFENLAALVWIAGDLRHSRSNSPGSILTPGVRSRITLWLVSQIGIVVLYLPWLPTGLRQAIDPPVPPWRSFADIGTVAVESFSALALGQSILQNLNVVWPVLVIIAVLVGLAVSRDRNSTRSRPMPTSVRLDAGGRPARPAVFLFASTAVPVAAIFLLSLWKPLYHVRYVFLYAPGFYLLVALGIVELGKIARSAWRPGGRLLAPALVLVILAASAYSDYNFWFDPQYADDDLRGAVQHIAAEWRPGDAVLVDAGYVYTAFVYYYHGPIAWRGRLTDYTTLDAAAGAVVLQTGSIGGGPNLGWGSPESDFYATTAQATTAALDRVFASHPRVWLLRLYDTVVDPDGVIRRYLQDHGRAIDDQGIAGIDYARVQGYLTPRGLPGDMPASATSRRVLLGDRIALLGFEPDTTSVHAGSPLDVKLYWQAKEPTNVDTHLFVGLYSQDGRLAASGDEIPLGNAWGTSHWTPGEVLCQPVRLTVPREIDAGDYSLRVSLYNPLTNEPLSTGPGAGVVEASQIELTRVHIIN